MWGQKKPSPALAVTIPEMKAANEAVQKVATALGLKVRVEVIDTAEEEALDQYHAAELAARDGQIKSLEDQLRAERAERASFANRHQGELAEVRASEMKWRELAGNLERQLDAARTPPVVNNHINPDVTFAIADLSGDVPRFFAQKGGEVAAFTAQLLEAVQAKKRSVARSHSPGNGSMALRPISDRNSDEEPTEASDQP